MFFLFISGTELSKVPGLSSAGANPDVVPLTAPADADIVQYGWPKIVDFFPLDPEGHPTPAIITRAAILEAGFPHCVVRAGSYIPPAAPYIELGADFGRNPCLEPAVPHARQIFENARTLAQSLAAGRKFAMLAESVPGGTTTALLALRALGYSHMVSSGGPENPTDQKEAVWQSVAKRLAIQPGDLREKPLDIVAEMGDPMQAAVLGFISGTDDATEIALAGGTQMLAIAALLRAAGSPRKPLIATTKYVAMDASSSFNELADELGLETYAAPLDFSKSKHKGLRDYELGYIKEGAGAGGAVFYASRLGISPEQVAVRTNALYAEVAR